MDNSSKESYYKNLFERIQSFSPTHLSRNDINSMLRLLKVCPLPHIIRINKNSQYHEYVKQYFLKREMLNHISDNIYELKDGLRKIDRKMAKIQKESKSSTQEAEDNSDRLIFNTLVNLGIVTNQELVSMIPSSFIISIAQKHEKSDFYLDLCAAPGSKSTHIIDNDINLITNEVVRSRAHILNARLGENTQKFVLCNDGRKIPIVKRIEDDTITRIFKFNSVLVDVPCSGDGTFRKNFLGDFDNHKKQSDHIQSETLDPNIVKDNLSQNFTCEAKKTNTVSEFLTSQNPKAFNVQGFHKNPFLNIELIERALKLADNYVIYSTCSLDPIENEFVISKIDCEISNSTEIGNNIFEFVNHTHQVQQTISSKHRLVYRPGLTEYKDGDLYFKNKDLERTMRFYPHDNNSGGFFVAILKKKETKEIGLENIPNNLIKTLKMRPTISMRINNSIFNQVSDQLYVSLVSFYKLNIPKEYIFIGTEKTEKKIIMFNSLGAYSLAKATNCISFGCTVFEKDKKMTGIGETGIAYKISNLTALAPFITQHIVISEVKTLKKLLNAPLSKNEIDGEKNQNLLTEWNGAYGIFSFRSLFFKGYIGNKITFYIKKAEIEAIERIVLSAHE